MCSSDLMFDRPTRLFLRWRDRGDAAALAELFDRTAPELLRLALHLCRHAVDAEDVLQATFLAAIESAFLHLATGRAQNTPRARVRGERIMLHSMSASADYLGLVGWKCYTTTPRGARFLVGLYSSQSGELLALIEADYLEIGRAHV